jgi:hypothetical protein
MRVIVIYQCGPTSDQGSLCGGGGVRRLQPAPFVGDGEIPACSLQRDPLRRPSAVQSTGIMESDDPPSRLPRRSNGPQMPPSSFLPGAIPALHWIVERLPFPAVIRRDSTSGNRWGSSPTKHRLAVLSGAVKRRRAPHWLA